MPDTTLLCPTDFSPSGNHAVAHALALADQLGGGTVRLVHVHHVPLHEADVNAPHVAADLDTSLRTRLSRRLEAMAAEASTERVEVEAELCVGVPWREILAAAQRANAEMIVMGTVGHGGLARLLLGSVAERVVRMADRPVMTVRTPAEGNPS